ncbi:hypothetical protein Atep_10590 [Allochromatium tepidum]|uniref:Transposase n=1 Tax=Allochromatium tepidum TaxID=553982 RepID=A0ABM7QKX1_9GAMM|nr:hypothetical protein Atep_10590 [Allochromatium tepidum]
MCAKKRRMLPKRTLFAAFAVSIPLRTGLRFERERPGAGHRRIRTKSYAKACSQRQEAEMREQHRRLGSAAADDPSARDEVAKPSPAPAPNARSPARYLWAMLPARLFESLPLVCPNCGADMRIIAFITEATPVERILTHLGEPPRPPPISPTRRPSAWARRPSRCRTGTSSSSPSLTSRSISASAGSRRLVRETVPSAFVLPPSGMTPSLLKHAASPCNERRARSLRHVSGP